MNPCDTQGCGPSGRLCCSKSEHGVRKVPNLRGSFLVRLTLNAVI